MTYAPPLISVDSAAILERTLVHLHSEIVRAGATIQVGHLPMVYAEPSQLGRVFQNLISNACNSARPGRTARILVSADRLADAWQLSVTDDGAGVAAEDRERIFELFTRGRVWVEDVPGGGSRFSFVLPDIDST